MVRYDPFAPPGRQARPGRAPDPVLPEARLRRLGATDRQVMVAGLWWAQFHPDDQRDAATALSEMTDDDMRAWMVATDVPDGSIPTVMDWVEAADDRQLAAYMAALVEQTDAKPRTSLLEALTRLSNVE